MGARIAAGHGGCLPVGRWIRVRHRMGGLDYSAAGVGVREDIREAHRALGAHMAAPGTWWTGAERVAIAAESRAAADCGLCRERKAALSPAAVQGRHEAWGGLSALTVDVIHRVRTDAGRLTSDWFEGVIAAGLSAA